VSCSKCAACCSTLQYVAVCCSKLQYFVSRSKSAQFLDGDCDNNTLQLELFVVSRNKRHHHTQHSAAQCRTLQHTATHCNTLQHTATHCNTLQHGIIHCIHCIALQHKSHHQVSITNQSHRTPLVPDRQISPIS